VRYVLHHSTLLYLAETGAVLSEEPALLAPSSSRSHVLSALHERVQRGDLAASAARARLSYLRGLRLRLLGDAVMQQQAWEVADRLGWPTTYDAEYVALTMLQADALISVDRDLASAVRGIVRLESARSIIA
jgi:predicted nucleic acid-binding protein